MLREPPTAVRRPPKRDIRRWRDEFRQAARGVKLGVRGHSRFAVHIFVAAAAVAACTVLECQVWEWGLVLLSIGAVFTAELFKCALVALAHTLDPTHPGPQPIAAGAVLTMGAFAALVGGLVIGNRAGEWLGWWG